MRSASSVARGQHDHRHRREGPQPPAHLEPVDAGQHQIEDQQIGGSADRQLERRGAVAHRLDAEAVPAQVSLDDVDDRRVIVREEDRCADRARLRPYETSLTGARRGFGTVQTLVSTIRATRRAPGFILAGHATRQAPPSCCSRAGTRDPVARRSLDGRRRPPRSWSCSTVPTAPVIDVGCGPGRHVAELAARGAIALGIDISAAAAATAARARHRRALRARCSSAFRARGTGGRHC